MLRIICWMIVLATYEPGAAEVTDWMQTARLVRELLGTGRDPRLARPGISLRSR